MLRLKTQVDSIIRDLGGKCINGFSEKWLNNCANETFRQLKKIHLKTYRVDSKPTKKMGGGGAMKFVPKNLNPNLRKDLVHTNEHNLESLLIERNISNDVLNKKKQLTNVSFNPIKFFSIIFRRIINKH